MRKVIFVIVIYSFNIWAQEKVLVSYFKPFGIHSTNSSKDVAFELEKMHKLKYSGMEVVLCPLEDKDNGLDVSFYSKRDDISLDNTNKSKFQIDSSAFGQLLKCLDEHPEIKTVYSLGLSKCEIVYETTAYNVMKTGSYSLMADGSAKLIPLLHKIDATAETHIQIDGNKNILAYCMANLQNKNEFSFFSRVGHNPGTFVCNNIAYLMSRYIASKKVDINFEFIHVPSSTENPYCKKSELSRIISDTDTTEQKDAKLNKFVAEHIADFITAKKSLLNNQKFTQKRQCSFTTEIMSKEAVNFSVNIMDLLENSEAIKKCYQEIKNGLQQKIQESLEQNKNPL